MVDSISNSYNTPVEGGTLSQLQLERVKEVNQQAAELAAQGPFGLPYDEASISDHALAKFEAEKEVLQFARLAQRLPQEHDADKVGYFKGMLESGRINDYFRSLDNEKLAEEILQGPAGDYLKAAAAGG